MSCTCGRQITFSSSVFVLFPPQDSGKWNCGWWFRLSNSFSSALPFSFPTSKLRQMQGVRFHIFCANLQHVMHLRQANYIFFLCLFPFPTSRLGKMKLWVVLQVVKFILFSSALFISYLKTPANLSVGGRISYYCANLQHVMHLRQAKITFSSSVFFFFPPQDSGKWNCGWWYRLSHSFTSVLPFSSPTSKLRQISM